MDDAPDVVVPDGGDDVVDVRGVALDDGQAGIFAEIGEPRRIGRVVQADHGLVPGKQIVGDAAADEPGAAGHQDRHGMVSPLPIFCTLR